MTSGVDVEDVDAFMVTQDENDLGHQDEAPYGYKTDGTPRKSNGGKPGGAAAASPGPAPRSSTRTRSTRSSSGPRAPRAHGKTAPGRKNYADNGAAIMKILAGAVGMVDPVDGAIIASFADQIGEVVDRAAQQDPRVAAFLDRMGGGSPLAELGITLGTMLLLIAAHHGMLQRTPLHTMMMSQVNDIVRAAAPAPAPA